MSTLITGIVIATASIFTTGMVSSGVLGVVELLSTTIKANPGPTDIVFSLKIGLDGAGSMQGVEPLDGAGGNVPRFYVYDEHQKLQGRSVHRGKCVDGQDNCLQWVRRVKRQPSYALAVGGKDSVCIAAISVSYPGGQQFGWAGNWAHTCDQPWYYSDIDVVFENTTVKLDCAWVGHDGWKDMYSTAIRIHWPEFHSQYTANDGSAEYFCNRNHTALAFFHNKEPRHFNGMSDWEFADARRKATKGVTQVGSKRSLPAGKQKRSMPAGMHKRSVQSHHAGHSAKRLCGSESAMGPSLVSMPERVFCHMPDQVQYRFCEDVESGTCWDHVAHKFDSKGLSAIQARRALPNIQFDKPLVWGKKK